MLNTLHVVCHFTQPPNKYLLNGPGSVLGTKATAVNKADTVVVPLLLELRRGGDDQHKPNIKDDVCFEEK